MLNIGLAKQARRAYGLDEVAIVPSRRTRSPEEVSLAWRVDAYALDTPFLAAPMDSVMSPATCILLGRLGALGILDLEGLWCRYENPENLFERIAAFDQNEACRGLQQLYSEPIKPELIKARLGEIRREGVIVAGCLSPQATKTYCEAVLSVGVDIFVIRGNTVSAEHVSAREDALNLKKFIYELDVPVIVGGVASYSAALHMMRTGAAGVLVGFGGGAASTTRASLGVSVPMATALADVARARLDYLEESGGRYVQVIADGSMSTSGNMVCALGVGADALMIGTPLVRALESPGMGYHWGREAYHPDHPRGRRVYIGQTESLEAILYGPTHTPDGTGNLVGALKRALSITGYSELKAFQRVEMAVSDGFRI